MAQPTVYVIAYNPSLVGIVPTVNVVTSYSRLHARGNRYLHTGIFSIYDL